MRVGKNDVNRKVFSLKDFRGVDYASSPLEVKPYRATDMANLLLRDGMLRKRYGFKQIYKNFPLVDEGYTFEEQYDVKLFTSKTVNNNKICVQYWDKINKKCHFYLFTCDWKFVKSVSFGACEKLGTSVEVDGKVYIYFGYTGILQWDNENLYLIDGKSSGKIFYAPTTTINIPPIICKLGYNLEKPNETGYEKTYSFFVDEDVRFPYQSHESINMLTGRRKVQLLIKKDLDYGVSVFGGPIYFKLDGKALIPDSYSEEYDYVDKYGNPTLNNEQMGTFNLDYSDSLIEGEFAAKKGYCWFNSYYGLMICKNRSYAFSEGAVNPTTASKDNYSILAIYDRESFLETVSDKEANEYGYITLTLEYVEENSIGNSSKILSCNCATTFGVDGANDRIFVGGGENANIIYFSENDISLKPNPTYFPADQFLVCGSSNAPISGFMRVTDGTLAIFKDTTKTADVSVYYANGYYTDAGTGEEGNTYKQARFTVKAGDISRRGISAKAIANLDGDNIFTSEEGVYGIQLSSNVASGERYAKERSRTINPKITQFDLQNARGIVYKDKYFLAVGEGEVYVADARYTFTMQGDQQNTFNYEWFRLTGLNVLEWFIYDDKLHFIDKDGYICEITEDSFADQYLVRSTDGELEMDVKVEDGTKSGTVTFNSKDRLALVKASSYAIDHKGRKWQLELINDNTFKIPDNIINEADIVDSGDLVLWFCVPIAAYWQSAVMDLNSPMYLKNMWSLSMVVSAKHGGKINLGYKTRMNAVSNIEVEGANASTWGQAIDLFGGMQTSMLTGVEKPFGMYTFDAGGYVGINTYTRRIFDRNFAHIQLLFTSENTADCAVAEMDIEYSIARKNIGVG